MPTGGYSRSDTIRWEDCPPPLTGHRVGKSLVQVSTQGRRDLALPGAIFGQKSSRKPSPREQRSKRHSKQRKQARCQGQRSPGIRGHCFRRRQPRQEKSVFWEVGQAQPRPPAWSPGSSSQALTARCGAGPIVSVQGTELQVTVLRGTLLSPQHPGVGSNLVQRGPLGGPQGQTPLNELLALCRQEEKVRRGSAPCPPRSKIHSTHLGRPSSGRTGGHGGSPHPAQRGYRRTPYRRAAHPGTTRWQSARGSGGSESTLGGCTPGCLSGHRESGPRAGCSHSLTPSRASKSCLSSRWKHPIPAVGGASPPGTGWGGAGTPPAGPAAEERVT